MCAGMWCVACVVLILVSAYSTSCSGVIKELALSSPVEGAAMVSLLIKTPKHTPITELFVNLVKFVKGGCFYNPTIRPYREGRKSASGIETKTHHIERIEEFERQVLRHYDEVNIDQQTISWLSACFRFAHEADALVKKVEIPVWIAIPDEDWIVDSRETYRVAALNDQLTVREFPNSRHSLFYELEETYALLIEEIDQFFTGLM